MWRLVTRCSTVIRAKSVEDRGHGREQHVQLERNVNDGVSKLLSVRFEEATKVAK